MIFFMFLMMMFLILALSLNLLDKMFLMNKMFLSFEIECGVFNEKINYKSSMIYTLFLILFLIFDLEIIMFFCLINNFLNILFMLIVLMVLFSLILELFECSLKWND